MTRSALYRNFVLIASSQANKKSRKLSKQFKKTTGICHNVDHTLVVSTRDLDVMDTLGIDIDK